MNINEPIDPGVTIGHVHLKVADLERSLTFYCGVLGFDLKQRYGKDAAFIAAGSYHHIGLNTWESKGGSPPTATIERTRRVGIATPLRTEKRGGGSLQRTCYAAALIYLTFIELTTSLNPCDAPMFG